MRSQEQQPAFVPKASLLPLKIRREFVSEGCLPRAQGHVLRRDAGRELLPDRRRRPGLYVHQATLFFFVFVISECICLSRKNEPGPFRANAGFSSTSAGMVMRCAQRVFGFGVSLIFVSAAFVLTKNWEISCHVSIYENHRLVDMPWNSGRGPHVLPVSRDGPRGELHAGSTSGEPRLRRLRFGNVPPAVVSSSPVGKGPERRHEAVRIHRRRRRRARRAFRCLATVEPGEAAIAYLGDGRSHLRPRQVRNRPGLCQKRCCGITRLAPPEQILPAMSTFLNSTVGSTVRRKRF